MRSLLARLVSGATGVASAPVRLTTSVLREFDEALPAPALRSGVLAAAREMVGGAPSRRCWRTEDRCWIEVRGLEAQAGAALGEALVRSLRAVPGVRSARINGAVSRVVVSVEPAGPSLDELCGIVADVEARIGADDAAGTRGPARDLPGDAVELGGLLIATAANGVGMCAAAAGRIMLWPTMPAGVIAAVTAVDYQPALRSVLERRLGGTATNTALSVAAASVYAITQAPASLAVEFLRHASQLGERTAAAAAWQRHEPALAGRGAVPVPVRPPTRPRPMPPGPVERHADRSSAAQGVAAASVGFLSRDLNAAATAAVVTAPKAARNAREGFASTLGRGLADRHDVLPLRPDALRRLDRIDAVVVDPRVLLTKRLRVSRLRSVSDRDREEAWNWARAQVRSGVLDAGWHRTPLSRNGHRNGHPVAEVLVTHAHEPAAAGVIAEIRRAEVDAVSVASDELGDLRPSFDDLHPVEESIDAALEAAVLALQADGRTVAVLSGSAARALAAADLAIGVYADDAAPPWQADLLVSDLDAAWRIMHALPAAKRASQRGVELSTSATFLGALLMIPGVRGLGPGPVTAGAAAGLATGVWLARTVFDDEPPAPAPAEEWHAMSVDEVRQALPQPTHHMPPSRSRLAASAGASAAVVGNAAGSTLRLMGEIGASVRDELSDPLTPVLAVGSAASALLGSPIDAILVGSVLTGNAILAASQQVRAERLLRRLLAVQVPPARRVTDDGHDSVDAAQLVPGDLIEVRSGEVIPADCRIVEAVDLEVDESALTGESLPVAKQSGATPGAAVAERSCMLYATTTVVAGTAVAVVTTVGAQTQARRAAEVTPASSSAVGLAAQLRELTNRALPISLAGGALVSGLSLLRLVPLRQAVASGVAVAVAAVPEGLPLVATLAQQASARRLSAAGALVRTPKSVEALGRVDVVCFDKTGTLSENRLRVSRVRSAEGFTDDEVLTIAAQATPVKNGTRHEHATDAAVVAAAPAGAELDGAVVHLPFRSGRSFSASLVGTEIVLKGAPEVIIAACADGQPAPEPTIRAMAEAGLRVIAVARRSVSTAEADAVRRGDEIFAELCGRDLRMVGLLGISDTPREASAGVLAALQRQDIGVRLVTGDHPVTAAAIATELGLPVTVDQVISGSDWEQLSRRDQERTVRQKVVFARMTPEHKVQVVQTLERTGLVCAMVGDGANDAAAIRSATVGIGVAAHGSDPARTAADVMLLDGRIGALLDAVDEGRQLWRRVQSAVSVLLGGNAGEVAFAIVGSALTGRSPLNTRQLLLVNMMTDALPAAALAVSPATGSAAGAGRGPDQAALWRTVAIRGATTAVAATSAWFMAGFVLQPRRASTVALVALVSTQLGQTLIDSHSPLVVSTAVGSLVTLGTLISIPGVSQLLGCTPLGPVGWTQALGTAGVATAAAVVAPRVVNRFHSSMTTTPSRHNAAYISRSGIEMTRVTTETGSEEAVTPEVDTPSTVQMADV
ncbi:P-type ATPase, translocating [Mycolicibacterium chubuense NBB4]|uniref:P-type ATPase, translocating n=1 Tax=Mycolicibacterium chubuense (strain NBB4) TaxID=710421 RepID=I4BRC8_MYCCN|nr:cation-translocating P-type ATPase [Mycolicibacterium chubuense]AFM19835.1 P-type ATPase, translocating [Mycolicibacterium chubuense NBB4]